MTKVEIEAIVIRVCNDSRGWKLPISEAIEAAYRAGMEASEKIAKDYDDEVTCDGICGTMIAERISAAAKEGP